MKKLLLTLVVLLIVNIHAHSNTDNQKVCSGIGGWTKDGEFKITSSTCITEKEYQAMLNSKEYLCNYYQKSIWKESEREYGKQEYNWAAGSLEKIKSLKEEGKSLCDSGKLKEGESKLKEAINIINHTKYK